MNIHDPERRMPRRRGHPLVDGTLDVLVGRQVDGSRGYPIGYPSSSEVSHTRALDKL